MAISLGSSSISAVKLGTSSVSKVYLGTNLIFPVSSITAYSSSEDAKPSQACSATLNQTYYHNGSGTYPVVGDSCYSNVAGTTALPAGTYRMATAGISGAKYVVGLAGSIRSITNC